MNGLSHKHAIQWIHRRLDGLLSESQLLALEEHLRSCDSCHAYATNMDGLSAHLQNEFHRRWDEKPGPTQYVMEHVTAKAKRIPMTNRIFLGAKLLAGAMALIVVAFAINFVVSRLQSTSPVTNATETIDNVSRAEDRLLAFTSDQNGNSDIYIIHADGSGLTNITNNPAYDGLPFWSPDGRQIAFTSNRDGSLQVYLMNADGSNVIQVTNGAGNYGFDGNGHTPWSPDGRKLIAFHASLGAQNGNLYVIDIDEKTITTLTHEPGSYMHPSWSLDGNYIAFTADTGRTPKDLFLVGSDGNHLTKLTEKLSNGEFFMFDYEWSPNGMSLFFTTDRNQQAFQDATYTSTVYEASMDGSIAVAAKATDRPIMSWWNGIAVRRESEPRLSWLRPDGSQSMLDLCPDNGQLFGTAHKRSYNGNLVVGSNCSDRGWMLYWANQDGTMIHPLLNSPISTNQDNLFQMTWSPDDQYIAFVGLNTASPDVTETLYVLDIAKAREDPSIQPLKMTNSFGPSWQPVVSQEIVEEEPTPEPTQIPASESLPPIGTAQGNGEWIAFIGGTVIPDPIEPAALTMNLDVYRVHPDGSELTNLTEFPAYYYGLQWSPDGQHLLFVRENSVLNKINIMRHYASPGAGYGEVTPTISDPDHYGYSWSPNSDKIIFADSSSGNYDIYTVYADGRNDPKLTQLTDDPAQDVGFAWSPDGSQIAFQRLAGDKLSIYVMNEDGSDPREIARGTGHVELLWSHDGTSMYASGTETNWLECEGCVAKPAIYRIQLDGPSVQQIYFEEESSKVAGWYLYDVPQEHSQNVLYFMRVNRPNFVEFWGTWFRFDGTSVTEIGELDPQQTCKTTTGSILHESISPNPRFSVISNFCAGGFDLYLADREAAPEKRFTHLLRLPLDTWGQGGDSATLPMGWSPDGRWLIYENAANATTYLLNIEKVIQDPTTQPISLIQPDYYTDPSGQVFQSSEAISLFGLTWQPKP